MTESFVIDTDWSSRHGDSLPTENQDCLSTPGGLTGNRTTATLPGVTRELCRALFDADPRLLLGAPDMYGRLDPRRIVEGSGLDEHDPAVLQGDDRELPDAVGSWKLNR